MILCLFMEVKAKQALMSPSLEELRYLVMAMHWKNLYLGSICYDYFLWFDEDDDNILKYIYLAFLKISMMHQEKITLGKIQAYWMYGRCNNEALSQFWGWEKGTLQRTSDKQQLKRATFLLFNWKFWVFSVFLLHKNVWVNLCGYQ